MTVPRRVWCSAKKSARLQGSVYLTDSASCIEAARLSMRLTPREDTFEHKRFRLERQTSARHAGQTKRSQPVAVAVVAMEVAAARQLALEVAALQASLDPGQDLSEPLGILPSPISPACSRCGRLGYQPWRRSDARA